MGVSPGTGEEFAGEDCRKRHLDPEEPRVGLATWETAGQRSVTAEVQVEQMPGSQRGKSAQKSHGLQTWSPGNLV